MNGQLIKSDFTYYINLIKLELKSQKKSYKELSDNLNDCEFSIDIIKKILSNNIKDQDRQARLISLCLQDLQIPIQTLNKMVDKYKKIQSTQKILKCSITIYEQEIRPILLDDWHIAPFLDEFCKTIIAKIKDAEDSLDNSPRIPLNFYINTFGLPIGGLKNEILKNSNMEDYFYLILQYFELSDEMRDFWVKYWDDDDKEDPYDFSKKTIKKMKKQLEGARPRLSNFTLSSDFDILYRIYHNLYSKKLKDYIDVDAFQKNLILIKEKINRKNFTKNITTASSQTFQASCEFLFYKIAHCKNNDYNGAWSTYYYLLNEKNIKNGKEKKYAKERKEDFFKIAFAYSFYLNSKKSD